MTRQLGFFESIRQIPPRDSHLAECEKPRLGRQAKRILDRLREAPASNSDLAVITPRYGGRLWDLRKAGCVIATEAVDRANGIFVYRLTHEPQGF